MPLMLSAGIFRDVPQAEYHAEVSLLSWGFGETTVIQAPLFGDDGVRPHLESGALIEVEIEGIQLQRPFTMVWTE
jgi:hypothetical protein